MTIFLVNSNLNHNGTVYTTGQLFEGELSEFGTLVNDGVLKVVEAATLAEAAQMVAEGSVTESSVPAPDSKAQDTWGAQPDKAKTEDVKKPEMDEGLSSYTVLKEFEVTNPDSKNFGKHAVGEVIEADPKAAQALMDNGTLEAVEPTETQPADATPAAPTETGENL